MVKSANFENLVIFGQKQWSYSLAKSRLLGESFLSIPRVLGVSKNSLRNHFEVQITPWQRIQSVSFFALILTPSFLGNVFVPGPLGDLKRVSSDFFGSTDSVGSV